MAIASKIVGNTVDYVVLDEEQDKCLLDFLIKICVAFYMKPIFTFDISSVTNYQNFAN